VEVRGERGDVVEVRGERGGACGEEFEALPGRLTSTKNDAITHTKMVELANEDRLPSSPPKPTAPETP